MSFDLIILVEESSMKNVLDIILPKIYYPAQNDFIFDSVYLH